MSSVLLAVASTTTTVVPRIVGKPLSLWVWWGSGLALLVAILLAGWYVGRRTKQQR